MRKAIGLATLILGVGLNSFGNSISAGQKNPDVPKKEYKIEKSAAVIPSKLGKEYFVMYNRIR